MYRSYSGSMRVKDVSLTLYGTANVPSAVSLIPSTCDSACAQGCVAAGPEFCDACVNLRNAETLECIIECPTGFTERHRYCYNASLPEPRCDRSYAMSAGSVNIKYSVWSWAIVTFMIDVMQQSLNLTQATLPQANTIQTFSQVSEHTHGCRSSKYNNY